MSAKDTLFEIKIYKDKKTHESRREGVARLLMTEYGANTWCLSLQSHKFINAYAGFLKRQGKLPVPG